MCEPVGQVLPLGRMPSNSSHCLQLWRWDCTGQGLWSRGVLGILAVLGFHWMWDKGGSHQK